MVNILKIINSKRLKMFMIYMFINFLVCGYDVIMIMMIKDLFVLCENWIERKVDFCGIVWKIVLLLMFNVKNWNWKYEVWNEIENKIF